MLGSISAVRVNPPVRSMEDKHLCTSNEVRKWRAEADDVAGVGRILRSTEPVLLQGLAAKWPATLEWSLPYLADVCGHAMVPTERLPSSAASDPFLYLQYRTYKLERLDSVVAELRGGSATSGRVCIPYAPLLEETHSLKSAVPPPVSLHALPKWLPRGLRVRLQLRSGLWVGATGTVSPLHFDRHPNVNIQIHGRKRWVLFSPADSGNLYFGAEALEPVQFCPVDIDNPDLSRFPRFARARPSVAIMEPGDALFVPPGWWHHVTALSDSINVNYWWWSAGAIRTVARIMLMTGASRLRNAGRKRAQAESMPM
jgi:[protein]-arginine 3-hydroxylase / protease